MNRYIHSCQMTKDPEGWWYMCSGSHFTSTITKTFCASEVVHTFSMRQISMKKQGDLNRS